jgi:ABC-2 type transport system permease protein
MKRFVGFVIKEFHHILRDPRTMVILFGIPIAQMLLFGFVITNEVKNVDIAVYDRSNDAVTREVISKLNSSKYFHLKNMIYHENDIENSLKNGSVKEVVVFEAQFAEKLKKEKKAAIHLVVDASDANTANLIVNYTTAIIIGSSNEITKNYSAPLKILTESRMYYNEQLKGVYMFVPGIMAMILILISALLTSISIVREKELGTMEILLVSPLRPLQIVIGKVTPYILLSFVNAIVIILLGYFVFQLPVQGNILLLLAECMLFIIMSLSLGIFISTVTNSQQVAMFLSLVVLMLPTILLSGFIFPIENMPLVLQWLCKIMPPTYFIAIVKSIMLKGLGLTYIWKETAVITLMTVMFIGISIKKFKIRLE